MMVTKPDTLENNRPPFELYDMKNAPGQMINVFGAPELEEIRYKLMTELKQWQQETDDTILNEMIATFKR
jgi:hypothetical protein